MAARSGEVVIDFDAPETPVSQQGRFIYEEDGFRLEVRPVLADGESRVKREPFWITKKISLNEKSPDFPPPFSGTSLRADVPGVFARFRLVPDGPETARLISIDVYDHAYAKSKTGVVLGFTPQGGVVSHEFTAQGQSAVTVQLPEFAVADISEFVVISRDSVNVGCYSIDNIRFQTGAPDRAQEAPAGETAQEAGPSRGLPLALGLAGLAVAVLLFIAIFAVYSAKRKARG
jgi:hypothetical protein